MEYKQYYTIDAFFENSYLNLENFDNKGPATEYKWKGKTYHLSPIVAQKLKCFIKWMTHEERPYELHDDFLATLTRDSYLKLRHLDTQSFSSSPSSHHEPSKFKTSFQGEFKHQTTSESQTALNNFKKGTKSNTSVYPIFKNDKASMMLLTLIMILRVVTSMNKNFSRGNSPLYILFWLLPYKQKRGEN